ncbi:hypothetical protein BaRGS_00021966 [Batillaria attramentaria]|uniref:Uncharacterized protein n=1 Tax=Batillaria attramentaria TaxID=370345 RepID=A0ABD0KIG8_9CAEN
MQEQGGAPKKPDGDPGKKQPDLALPPQSKGPLVVTQGRAGLRSCPSPCTALQDLVQKDCLTGNQWGRVVMIGDLREQALREKQNENHQILKEKHRAQVTDGSWDGPQQAGADETGGVASRADVSSAETI